jgi:hypothetical protein
VRDLRGVVAALSHRLRDIGEAAGGVSRDVEHRAAGTELLRIGKQPAQALQVLRRADVLEADRVGLARRACEVGVDLGDLAIADDKQRRVIERESVSHELAQGASQIATGAFVLPAKVAPLPHVGPAMAGARPTSAALEAVAVLVVRRFHPKHRAQIKEEGL